MYIKVTDEFPFDGEEVWSYNGEHEIKNKWNGKRWQYEFKYPTTHWTRKPQLPDYKEVLEVRDAINRSDKS